jgi:hypothetical protein
MGYTAEESDPRGLYTKKSTSALPGDVVWIIAGKGQSPKQYFLSSWFLISHVEKADHPDFLYSIKGEVGAALEPMPLLSGREWFPAFLARAANFSIGFHEIKAPDVIEAFRCLAADAGCPQA